MQYISPSKSKGVGGRMVTVVECCPQTLVTGIIIKQIAGILSINNINLWHVDIICSVNTYKFTLEIMPTDFKYLPVSNLCVFVGQSTI